MRSLPFASKYAAAVSGVVLLSLLAATGGKAATITETVTLLGTSPGFLVGSDQTGSSTFSKFNPTLGTLTAVDFQYTVGGVSLESALQNATNTTNTITYSLLDPSSQLTLASFSHSVGPSGVLGEPLSIDASSDTFLAQYIGLGTLTLKVNVTADGPAAAFVNGTIGGNPDGCGPQGQSECIPQVAITYDYTAGAAATPLPTALPLFASGLGALGLFGWRRRRKPQAVS